MEGTPEFPSIDEKLQQHSVPVALSKHSAQVCVCVCVCVCVRVNRRSAPYALAGVGVWRYGSLHQPQHRANKRQSPDATAGAERLRRRIRRVFSQSAKNNWTPLDMVGNPNRGSEFPARK